MHPATVPLLLATPGASERRALARGVEQGTHVRVDRGVYVEADDWVAAGAAGQHLLRMRALQGRSPDRIRFSHWSAAVVHGLPAPTAELDRIHRTDAVEPPERKRVCSHPLRLVNEDVVERHGLLVTAVPRTVVDIAATASFRDAVALADAGLRLLGGKDGTDRLLLAEAWERAQPRRPVRRIERVLDFADGRAQSVGESFSRVTIAELHLPLPELQHDFFDADGFIGCVDFWWPLLGVIGEFDGRIKYFDPALSGGDPARVVYREKQREDRLRALHPRLVRWGWREAVSAQRLGPKLAAAGLLP